MDIEIDIIYDIINDYPLKKKIDVAFDPWVESIIISFFGQNLGKDHQDFFLSFIQELDKLFYNEVLNDISNYNIKFSYRRKIAIMAKKIFLGLENFDLI